MPRGYHTLADQAREDADTRAFKAWQERRAASAENTGGQEGGEQHDMDNSNFTIIIDHGEESQYWQDRRDRARQELINRGILVDWYDTLPMAIRGGSAMILALTYEGKLDEALSFIASQQIRDDETSCNLAEW